mmetsp:Transcript_14301/g.45852  ORF Transcript_14301/g.45852 Transcript_14301/m.45852 type:complete len:250 (+) Transcript_14301:598-1347(+)
MTSKTPSLPSTKRAYSPLGTSKETMSGTAMTERAAKASPMDRVTWRLTPPVWEKTHMGPVGRPLRLRWSTKECARRRVASPEAVAFSFSRRQSSLSSRPGRGVWSASRMRWCSASLTSTRWSRVRSLTSPLCEMKKARQSPTQATLPLVTPSSSSHSSMLLAGSSWLSMRTAAQVPARGSVRRLEWTISSMRRKPRTMASSSGSGNGSWGAADASDGRPAEKVSASPELSLSVSEPSPAPAAAAAAISS